MEAVFSHHGAPCASCKVLRRRCSDKCVLAPYFPPTELLMFSAAHRVFGASNIVKLLQELPEGQRADAVSSLVYEARARVRDPVYGSAGVVLQLQRQAGELRAQLARAQAELAGLRAQHENLAAVVCMRAWSLPDDHFFDQGYNSCPDAVWLGHSYCCPSPPPTLDEDDDDASVGWGYSLWP